MGFLYKLGRIRSYILIILFFVVMLISAPVKRKVTSAVDNSLSDFKNNLLNSTGLVINYHSMSPSILSNFVIKEIQVSDIENTPVLSVDKVKINFSLANIFKRDYYNIVSSVVVDGINVDVDELISLVNRINVSSKQNKIDIAQLQQYIPANTKVKNINLHYEDSKLSGLVSVKNIGLNNNLKKGFVNLQVDASAQVDLYSPRKKLKGKLSVAGNVTHQLEKSQLNIKLLDLSDGNYSLNRLSFHLFYENNKIQLHTIQSVNPISIAADYNIKTEDLNAQLRTELLSPISIVSNAARQKELKKYKNISLDTDTIVKCNFNSKNINFITDTQVFIPDEIFPGGFTFDLSLFGNENSCELTKFSVDGENLNGSAQLNFIYKTKQLSGFAELNNLIVNGNKSISTEVYFDPLEKGFMAFSPQLFVGNKALTALQFTVMPQSDSYDFAFELYDYAHAESSEPGYIQLDGSYLLKSNYVQTNIGLNSIYLDSIADFAAQLLDEKLSSKVESVLDKLEPYVLSGDLYASTDLKSVSYNVPYVLIANTQKDNQVLMMSVNGSEQNLQLNQFSLIWGKYALDAAGTLDRNTETNDLFYTLDLNALSIPYHFSGNVMKNLVTVSGDYGTSVEINFDKNSILNGYAFIENIPFMISDNSVVFSLDSQFHYDAENGPDVQIRRFEAEIADGSVTVSPKIAFAGNVTKYGAQINSITYTDMYSALEGTSDLMLNINEGIFDSVGIMMNMKNPLSDEGIVIDGSISNPEHLTLSKETLLKNIYLNLQVQLYAFGLNRLGFQQNDNNRITATLYSSGTIEHPYLSVNIEESAVMMATDYLHFNGNVVLEDRELSVSDFFMNYKYLNINDLKASASLETMTVDASADLYIEILSRSIAAPLTLSVTNAIIPEGKFIPDSFLVNIEAKEFGGTMIKKPFPLSISAMYSDQLFTIYSSENCGLEGTYSTSGILQLTLDNKSFLKANLDGFVNSDEAVLQFYDFSADLHKVFNYLSFDDLIQIEKGVFNADVTITGSLHDPDFNGSGVISSPELKLPMFTNQKLTTNDMHVTLLHEEIGVDKFLLTTKGGDNLEAAFKIFLNKWSFNHVEGNVNTVKKELFPVKMNTSAFKLNGDVSLNLELYYEKPVLDLKGKIFGENVSLSSSIASVTSLTGGAEGGKKPFALRGELDINLGTHATVNFDPIIRCVFVPNTSIGVKVDQTDGSYIIDGKLDLKSGDLAYLNRNFYIKSGSVNFNSDDITNPLVTLNAETREKDEKGQTVKIILNVENQYLLDLNPRFTSVPAKSENELRSLLGQIVVADSTNAANFLFAASDYALQSTVMRTAENKLRELFNFDIFSLRTNVLQNTLNMSVSRNLSSEKLTVGNLLDNSTVYIGKYLGSSLYLDAMLHVSFEDRYGNDITSAGSLIFQPEFGMEMESPFANIRVNMAPDINALLNNQFVPSTSVTLSWKFTY